MRRDTLELADGSLFIERIKRTFTAADAGLVIRAHAFDLLVPIANVRISEDALVKVNGRTAALDLTLKDGDSIEVIADGYPSTGGIDTCTNRGNGFDAAASMLPLMED